MYSKDSFGNYYPIDSAIHRMNPLVKILNFILIVVITIISKNLYTHVFTLGLIIILMLLSFVPFIFYFNGFYKFRYIYIIMVITCFLSGISLENTLMYIIKIIVIIEYLFILVYTTTTNELVVGIRKLLFPLRLVFVNTQLLAIFITNIIKFIPMFVSTSTKILKSAENRGIDYSNSGIFGRMIALLKTNGNVIRMTINNLKESRRYQKSKLFSYNKKRSNYISYRIGFYDIIVCLFHITILIAFLMERGYFSEIFSRINI